MFDWLRRWFWFDDDDDEVTYQTSEDSWEEYSSFEDDTDMESDMITDPTHCFLEGNIYHDICDDHHDHLWDDSFDSHDTTEDWSHWDDTTDDWSTTDAWDSWDDSSSSWDDDW